MSTPERFRFTLTKRQVNDLEDNLLLDGDEYVNRGVEQPDGTFQFDLGYADLENLLERVATACNHAEDELHRAGESPCLSCREGLLLPRKFLDSWSDSLLQAVEVPIEQVWLLRWVVRSTLAVLCVLLLPPPRWLPL